MHKFSCADVEELALNVFSNSNCETSAIQKMLEGVAPSSRGQGSDDYYVHFFVYQVQERLCKEDSSTDLDMAISARKTYMSEMVSTTITVRKSRCLHNMSQVETMRSHETELNQPISKRAIPIEISAGISAEYSYRITGIGICSCSIEESLCRI